MARFQISDPDMSKELLGVCLPFCAAILGSLEDFRLFPDREFCVQEHV